MVKKVVVVAVAILISTGLACLITSIAAAVFNLSILVLNAGVFEFIMGYPASSLFVFGVLCFIGAAFLVRYMD